MIEDTFINISKIIERDSKTTTYKFALLRGTIDIIQDNSPYINIGENKVEIPLGLLIEKWLIYYYPIISSEDVIPQINGAEKKIAFHDQFKEIVNYYNLRGGLSAFFNDLRFKGISLEIKKAFISLINKLKSTITKMPMKYIGQSISNRHYSIYQYNAHPISNKVYSINTEWLINNTGHFTIPTEYYNAFKILGSFIAGTDAILFKWADFSVNASKNNISREKVIDSVLQSPITQRDVEDSKILYKTILKSSGEISCVWTGSSITSYDVDHLIPFSVWKNNDLWNLLPAHSLTNNRKRDKIPNGELLDKRKDLIVYYWELIKSFQKERFFNELRVSLIGNRDINNWQNIAFNQLKLNCKYLINVRGYEEWKT